MKGAIRRTPSTLPASAAPPMYGIDSEESTSLVGASFCPPRSRTPPVFNHSSLFPASSYTLRVSDSQQRVMGCAETKSRQEEVAQSTFDSSVAPPIPDENAARKERERLMEELDVLKAPDHSTGQVCREPIVGRAMIATFLAEEGGDSAGSTSDCAGSSHVEPVTNNNAPTKDNSHVSAAALLLSDTAKTAITEWRTALASAPVLPEHLASGEVKWEQSVDTGPSRLQSSDVDAREAEPSGAPQEFDISQTAEIGFFPLPE